MKKKIFIIQLAVTFFVSFIIALTMRGESIDFCFMEYAGVISSLLIPAPYFIAIAVAVLGRIGISAVINLALKRWPIASIIIDVLITLLISASNNIPLSF